MADIMHSMPMRRGAAFLRPRAGVIALAAVAFWGLGWVVTVPLAQMSFMLVAGILLATSLWLVIATRSSAQRAESDQGIFAQMLDADVIPSVISSADGAVLYQNPATLQALAGSGVAGECKTLAGILQADLANPCPTLLRLQSRADSHGAAHEDLVTGRGHLRVSVHRVGDETFLWRIESASDRASIGAAQVALPMLTVGRNNTILSMNAPARNLVGERVRSLDRLSSELPLRPGQANPILTKDGIVSCHVVELEGPAARREVFLLPDFGEDAPQIDGWAFFDELPVPLLKLGRGGAIHLSNRPARDLLGVTDCTGQPLGDMLEGLGRSITDWLEDAAAGRGGVHSEFMRVRRDDKEVFAQVTLNRVVENGEPVLIAVINDATKLKSLEAQFVQSQKMQAIGQLAGGVAHDFNNLLTAISGHCDLLLLRHDQGDPDYADLMQISQNANRAAALVNQLLAYSRKQTLLPQVMDPRDMLADMTHLLNRLVGEKVSLTLSHDPMLATIRADKRQLEQVLMNLVVNARDAMPDGGEIRIVTENLTLEDPMRRDRALVAPGRYVSVKVIDAGVGIAADKLQRVFEPFYTTKRTGEGTGLGLSTAYGIIKQTGGFIFVESQLGQGTTFQLLLPVHDIPQQATPPQEVREPGSGRAHGVVLLVEDEAPVRAFASRALQLRGFTVLECSATIWVRVARQSG